MVNANRNCKSNYRIFTGGHFITSQLQRRMTGQPSSQINSNCHNNCHLLTKFPNVLTYRCLSQDCSCFFLHYDVTVVLVLVTQRWLTRQQRSQGNSSCHLLTKLPNDPCHFFHCLSVLLGASRRGNSHTSQGESSSWLDTSSPQLCKATWLQNPKNEQIWFSSAQIQSTAWSPVAQSIAGSPDQATALGIHNLLGSIRKLFLGVQTIVWGSGNRLGSLNLGGTLVMSKSSSRDNHFQHVIVVAKIHM